MYRINEVIDIEVLQEIQDKFAKATGLAFVTVDFTGKPITSLSNFTPYCKYIRENYEECQRCDAYGGLEAVRLGKPYIYYCHCGLIDFAVPIIVQEQYMGAVLGGQVKASDDVNNKLQYINKNITDMSTVKEINDMYENINIVPYEKVESVAELIFKVVNYIIATSISKTDLEKFNAQNVKMVSELENSIKLGKALKSSELKAMRANMNSHFIFNALNTIVGLAVLEEAPKTKEVSYLFADMIRYVFKNNRNFIYVKKEVDQVERYLEIQKYRFADKLEYEICVDENILFYDIPHLMLQPLMENAIFHGLESKVGPGKVTLKGYKKEETLCFEVVDNGLGIPKKILDQIKDMDMDKYDEEEGGIGIYNTMRRLNYIYEGRHTFSIESDLGKGTKVFICLPIEEKV